MATYAWAGYDALMNRLGVIADPDPNDMLTVWEQIIAEDNRRGVLAGLDKDDKPMIPVTYRPAGRRQRKTKTQKNFSGRGVFAGVGPAAAGLHNNLTSAEYKNLGGPPLAPRGIHSRVITNYFTEHHEEPGRAAGKRQWNVVGTWFEVVDTKGRYFLSSHFKGLATGRHGATRLPRRDLRGVRKWGRDQVRQVMQQWGKRTLAGQK